MSARSSGGSNAGRTFTGTHMLILMVAFFFVVIAVNITMAVLASTSWTGLVAKNGYVASIDFAREEQAREEAARRGWRVRLEAPGGIVTLHARTGTGAALPAARSATAEPLGLTGEPRTLALHGIGGVLRADEPLPPGRYVLRADVGPGGEALAWRSVVTVGE